MEFSRRDLLKILGVSVIGSQVPLSALSRSPLKDVGAGVSFKGLSPNFEDKLLTAKGLNWQLLIKEGDELGRGLKFGCNNDYLQFFKLTSDDHGILWVNHEYLQPLLSSKVERTKDVIDAEMLLTGGSLVEIRKTEQGWSPVFDSIYNRRITGKTMIPFAAGKALMGKTEAMGMVANCAGGRTPWGTLLTCEENYDGFYGERDQKTGGIIPSEYQKWELFYQNPPEHYGWVVEVNPLTGAAKKHTSMGRFMHECATVRVARDGRPVVYSGDDATDEHLYKFISNKKGTLDEGVLYVANIEQGKWIPLVHSDPRLKKEFKDQLDILTHCRRAAKLVGATKLDRPEDIEIDPFKGDVLVACTNNKPALRPYGSILKIREKNNDPRSLTFTHEIFMTGGEAGGFACPDNLAFDRRGNLWFTTDMSGWDMHKGPLLNFGNNGLFVVMRQGPQAGIPVQVASAPMDAEFTGPLFSEDGKHLFLSVQHPGELTVDLSKPTSTWPTGALPRSGVIVLSGPLLEKITRG
jgi:hypothetical protein